MRTVIYLVRHGQTAANRGDIFAGRTQEPLHPEGIAQMHDVGSRLAGSTLTRIFCGPLTRTMQSAGIVGQFLSVPVQSEEALTEINIPHWDGLTKDSIRKAFGPQYPTWLNDPADFRVQGCETILDVQNRAVAFLEKLFTEYRGENLLVVSHLIVIRTLLLHYLDRPVSEFRNIKVGNAQLIALPRDKVGGTVVEI